MSAQKAPLRVEYVPIASLRPFDGNPRKISERGLEKLQRSIEEFGFVNPVLAQAGTRMVIAGHQRLKAAEAAGLDKVPVVFLDLDDVTAKAYNIADNRLQDEAEWDFGSLADLLAELDNGAVDLALTGFDPDEIERMMNWTPVESGEIEEDEVPEPPEKPVTQPGDLWLLGRHRLLCGDAGNPEDHRRLLGDTKPDLVLSDPPYGVGVEYGGFDDTEEDLTRLVERVMPLLLQWSPVLITTGRSHLWKYPPADWVLGWFEPAGVGKGPWGFICWQPVLAYGKDPYLKAKLGARPDAYAGKGEGASSNEHPVAKPLGVWRWLMERGSVKRGDVVLDPFVGSGTTIVVAEQLGRTCYAMEIDPRYCDVAIRRWERLTGQKAVREDGTPFQADA